MARDAASLIDALGLEHVYLFGFSMGGYVAQQIAVDRPDLVRRFILQPQPRDRRIRAAANSVQAHLSDRVHAA
jgi:pimeloyl-ACP methyl ester carboxylesterase